MPALETNLLYYGDNLTVLREAIPDESVDLIAIDPPFSSNRNYFIIFKDRTGDFSRAQKNSFEDTWSWGEEAEHAYRDLSISCANAALSQTIQALRTILHETPMMAYLVAMATRFQEMHRVLKPTGSMFVHCDPVASHYLKIVLDCLFGPSNFRNEITWKRTSAHNDAKHKFADVSDILLYYAKSKASPFFPQYAAHDTSYVQEFYRHDDGDGRGYYRKDNVTSPNTRPNLMYEWMGFPHPAKGWRYSLETMQRLHNEGRIHYPCKPDGSFDFSKRPALKRYLQEQEGSLISNVWTDIAPVQARGEALGYPTQKPMELLRRIILATTQPGDVVLDGYCGCGTTITAAHELGRKWIGIDIAPTAVAIMKSRMEDSYPEELRGKIRVVGFPTDFEGARTLFEQDPFRFQVWACMLVGAYPLTKKGADAGIDGWLGFADADQSLHRGVVQVKGGKSQVGHLRDFCHVVTRERASIGLFVTLNEITRPMQEEAIKEGFWTSAMGVRYPKIQPLPVRDLLDQRARPRYPDKGKSSLLNYIAPRRGKVTDQGALPLE